MNTPALPRRKPRSLAIDVVERLTDDILAGRLPAGSKLPTEASFMETFGVSRTVVREAISRLQAAALVETRHGIGTFVLAQEHGPAFRHRIPHKVVSLLEGFDGFLKIDYVDAVTFGENIRLHGGVPFMRPMPKMDTALQKRLHGNACHSKSFAFFLRGFHLSPLPPSPTMARKV